VVVVGAGLAGLACALELERRGFRVVVVEARDRVGGRVLTSREAFEGGRYAELGAEFLRSGDTAMRSLARGFRLVLEPASEGDPVVYRRQRRWRHAQFATPAVRADVARYEQRLTDLGRSPDRALDKRSALSLIRELRLRDRARFLVEHELRDTFGAEPENVSLLFLVQQHRLDRGKQLLRLRGGAHRLPAAMASRLRDVRLETPAQRVERRRSGVTVVAGGEELDADWSVLAVPVPILAAIEFQPELPPRLAAAAERLRYGNVVRTLLQYERRFWRKRGESGAILTDLSFQTAWEAVVGRPGGPGILATYTSGRNGLLHGTIGRRSRTLLGADEVDDVYPGSRALYLSGDTWAWHTDGWSRGSRAVFGPGQMTRYWDVLQRPVGRVWLAGEHADAYAGTMEGAVRSGRRVAVAIAGSG
jgi:monoamine oxidase